MSVRAVRRVRNYLRVRGEYGQNMQPQAPAGELPPRARRILTFASCSAVEPGTTSACAENTMLVRYENSIVWNYLRVRGEYKSTSKS